MSHNSTTPPSWLDESFLTRVLQGCDVEVEVEDSTSRVSVISWSVRAAVAAGNNYTSNLYQVKVRYTTREGEKSEALIVKAPIDQGFVKDLPGDFFGTEPRVYGELLPLMHRRTNTTLAPEAFHCPIQNGLVLKDMRADGYAMCNRFEHLDFQHCQKILETLAVFHASSVAIHKEDPELIETIGDDKFFAEGSTFRELLKTLVESYTTQFLDVIKDFSLDDSLLKYISRKASTLWETLADQDKTITNCLRVLNHGDCWIANMLFKYDDSGAILDAKLIDFQLPRFTTPVTDVLHVIWTSADEEVRENKQQELFTIYMTKLNNTLEELGCEERLTSEEFQTLLRSSSDWILFLISVKVPLVLNDTDTSMDIESLSPDNVEASSSTLHRGDHYRTLLPTYLRQYHQWLTRL